MEKRVKDAGLRNSSLGSKMKELNEELEAVRSQVEASHRKHRELLGVLEVKKEEKAELLGNRYKLFIGKMDTVVRGKYKGMLKSCHQRHPGIEVTEHHE